MTQKKLEELALGHALGTLNSAEERELESHVRNDVAASAEVSSYLDTAAVFAVAACPTVKPRADVRARIFAEIAKLPQARNNRIKSTTLTTQVAEEHTVRHETRELVTAGQHDASPFTIIASSPEGWSETDTPGFRTKLLSSGPQPGNLVMLLAFDPGVRIPDHHHEGSEEIYMLTGTLCTGGVTLGPGDFYRAEVGSLHEDVYSKDGCTALLICGPVKP